MMIYFVHLLGVHCSVSDKSFCSWPRAYLFLGFGLPYCLSVTLTVGIMWMLSPNFSVDTASVASEWRALVNQRVNSVQEACRRLEVMDWPIIHHVRSQVISQSTAEAVYCSCLECV